MRCALLIVLFAFSTKASAAPGPIPPQALGSMEVPYPDGASGDADVTLELVVEVDGAVSSVTIVEGDEPFAAAARSAASQWKFSPARRDGAAVRARIRARVAFHPRPEPAAAAGDAPSGGDSLPPPAPPGATSTAAPSAAAAAPAPDERPLEVTVRGRRREAGQTTLSDAEVRALPGAFGDAFRAVEALPGVVPLVSGFPYFFIRGAPPNDNGYFVDGIRVPLLFHIGIGQGVIHPGLVDRVDFFPGTAPVAYGGVAGAIIAGQTKEPAAAPHGEANLRLVDVGALVESPIGNDRGSVLVAGRYGYPGLILGLTSGLDLSYWDYQTRVTWRLTDRGTLSLFAFGSHDHLATPSPSGDPSVKPTEQMFSEFHRVDLRYDHALADGHVRIALTGGHDRQGAAPTYIKDNSAAARLEVETRVSPTLWIRGGASARLDAYGFTQSPTRPNDPPVPSTADPPPTNLVAGAYASATWQAGSRLELTPGARFDLFASSRATAPGAATRVRTSVPAFDPRLSARVTVTPSIALLSAAGLAHQAPALRVGSLPSPVVTVPGFPPGVRRLQTALQVSQGVEIGLPADIVVTGTGFFARLSGLTDLTNMCVQTNGDGTPGAPPSYVCADSQPVTGHAYGLEILARRPLSKRLSGWLSYTLSRSIRDGRFITADGGVALATVPSDADRTHVLNAVLALELGAGWRLGGRGLFYTGTPYSRLDGVIPAPPYNAYRTPSFFRLDVRLEKRWRVGNSGSIALVVEGQNVTLSTEYSSQALDCMDSPGMATRCKLGKIGPITLPSIGVEAFF